MKSKTFTIFIIFVSGVTLAYFALRQQDSLETSLPPLVAPAIEVIDNNNTIVKLTSLKGSVVVVNFWATWCQSCIEELPSFEQLFQHMAGNHEFTLITILFRDDEKRVLRYMKENKFTFPVYLDPDGSAARQFRITGVPETFIIDKKGMLREKVIGPAEWNSSWAVSLISKLINEPE
ncbi:MAG: TlpA family protein disulfide reductase [Nitrospira sp.]|nr:TlpA family protein disulfide reductase [Nitrospira sp.]